MGCYTGTMSAKDNYLFEVIQQLEDHEEQRLGLLGWGPVASRFSNQASDTVTAKEKEYSMAIDESLDDVQVYRSVFQIPLEAEATPVADAGADIYTPRFLLPCLLKALTSSALTLRAFVIRGGLAYAIASLASDSVSIRKFGYKILSKLQNQLSSSDPAHFKEHHQVALLLRSLRETVAEKHQQLPAVTTTFLIKALSVLQDPHHHMYLMVNKFLVRHGAAGLDHKDIHMFHTLFNSISIHSSRNERNWALELVLQGARTAIDAQNLISRGVCKSMMAHCMCALADDHSRSLVLQILDRVCGLPGGAAGLVQHTSFLSWMQQLLGQNENMGTQHELVPKMLLRCWHGVDQQRIPFLVLEFALTLRSAITKAARSPQTLLGVLPALSDLAWQIKRKQDRAMRPFYLSPNEFSCLIRCCGSTGHHAERGHLLKILVANGAFKSPGATELYEILRWGIETLKDGWHNEDSQTTLELLEPFTQWVWQSLREAKDASSSLVFGEILQFWREIRLVVGSMLKMQVTFACSIYWLNASLIELLAKPNSTIDSKHTLDDMVDGSCMASLVHPLNIIDGQHPTDVSNIEIQLFVEACEGMFTQLCDLYTTQSIGPVKRTRCDDLNDRDNHTDTKSVVKDVGKRRKKRH